MGERRYDGFALWTAAGTAATTALTFAIAILTPPLAGPWCRAGCVDYPYLDVVSRFPRDYFWMFPAMAATLFYLAMMVALHARAPIEHRHLSMLSMMLAVMAATVLIGDYFVQLAVMQPSLLAGEADGVAMLSQYNPHGIFIALEELGYLLMAGSLACMAPAMPAASRAERVVRWLFAGALLANIVAVAVITLRYGHGRAYLLEVAALSIDWLVLIVAGTLLAICASRKPSTCRPS